MEKWRGARADLHGDELGANDDKSAEVEDGLAAVAST